MLYESAKKYDFIKLNSSLRNFTKIQVSHSSSNLGGAFGIDMVDKVQSMQISECIQTLFKKITSELIKTKNIDYIQIDDINLDYNFPPELINKVTQTKFSTMIVNAKLGASIQDTVGYSPHLNSNVINTNGLMYKIGSFFGKEVYVDPYMRWNDARIILFDDVVMNFDNFTSYENSEATFATRTIIEFGYQMMTSGSMLLYVISDKNDPNYGEYLRITRDEKIDKIID